MNVVSMLFLVKVINCIENKIIYNLGKVNIKFEVFLYYIIKINMLDVSNKKKLYKVYFYFCLVMCIC